MAERNQKFGFAPGGYRSEWQHAPRRSGIAYGYFDRDYVPVWRHVERAVFWVSVAGLAVGLYFAGA